MTRIVPLTEVSRKIIRNPELHDGTGRREAGYRACITFTRESDCARLIMSMLPTSRVYQMSPLFKTEAEAMAWAGASEIEASLDPDWLTPEMRTRLTAFAQRVSIGI